MEILIAGLALFLGMHLVPALPVLRRAAAGALGEQRYKAAFSLVSAIGLVLIVWGYAAAPRGAQLFAPSGLARQLAPAAMVASFILLAAANMRTHIRRVLGHPMLLGAGLWSLVHLMASGHAKATLLFGGFLAYVALDLGSALARGARKTFEPKALHDGIAAGSGIALALLVMAVHRPLFGAAAVPWGF